jgi:predicted ATP-grasp superfamily ATP-dependent carboligase
LARHYLGNPTVRLQVLKLDAIILDGNERAALAVTRSLGSQGKALAVGAEKERSLAASSRYSAAFFNYPAPEQDPEAFFGCIREYVARNPATVLLPMTDITVSELLKRSAQCKGLGILPFVDYERYTAASDKINVLKLADRRGIATPRSILVENLRENGIERIVEDAAKLAFPLVVKPRFSRVPTENRWLRLSVRYALDEGGLRHILQDAAERNVGWILQERVEGPGIGIFLLMHDGQTFAKFAHRRIREKPPSGGVSVVSESIEPPAEALAGAERILRQLNWTGVAMVEFKGDRRDNRLKLMEINARFWGSLQLAISSGVDFPYLLFRLATGEKMEKQNGYKVGVRSRWELGDLDHLLLRLRKPLSELNLPADSPPIRSVLKDFVAEFVNGSAQHEVFRWKDPRPWFVELRQYVTNLANFGGSRTSATPL